MKHLSTCGKHCRAVCWMDCSLISALVGAHELIAVLLSMYRCCWIEAASSLSPALSLLFFVMCVP